MGHERRFRGQQDGQNRPFDWLTAARQHGISDKLARALYEQAVRQAHGASADHVEERYLALLADACRHSTRLSPGKVTRAMRAQAHRAGIRHGLRNSRLAGQPIAPGRRNLTSYIEPAIRKGRASEKMHEPSEADITSFSFVRTAIPAGSLDTLARARSIDGPEWPGKPRAVPFGPMQAPEPEHLVPGTIAHRRLQANLAAAVGHFEELDLLEEERIISESVITVETSEPRIDVEGGDAAASEVTGWPLPFELFPFDWEARTWRTDTSKVHADSGRPAIAAGHAWWPRRVMHAQVPGEAAYLRPPMATTGPQVENWGGARPIQAAGLQELPEDSVHLPGNGVGVEMPADVRRKMEATFGVDFSPVRIYEGAYVETVGALAYTQGSDIHFAPGQYQPMSRRGQELLGHELTHVVQQWQGRVRATTHGIGLAINDDAGLEREADEMGARAARAERGPTSPPRVREETPGVSALAVHDSAEPGQRGRSDTQTIQRQAISTDLLLDRIGEARIENLIILYIDPYVPRQETEFYGARSGELGRRDAYPRSFLRRPRTRRHILATFESEIRWLAGQGRWHAIHWHLYRFPTAHIATVPPRRMEELRRIAERVCRAIPFHDHTVWDEVQRVSQVTPMPSGSWEARVDAAFQGGRPAAKLELINEALTPERGQFSGLHLPVRTADPARLDAGGVYYADELPGRAGEALLGYRPEEGPPATSFMHGNPRAREIELVDRAEEQGRISSLFSFLVLGPGSLSRGSEAHTRSTLFHEYQHYQDFTGAIGQGGPAIHALVHSTPQESQTRHGRIYASTLRRYFTSRERWRGQIDGRGTSPFPSYVVADSLTPATLFAENFNDLYMLNESFDDCDTATQLFIIDEIRILASDGPGVRGELIMMINNLPDQRRHRRPSTFKTRILAVL